MAELVDARDLKSLDRKVVPVQFRPRAPLPCFKTSHEVQKYPDKPLKSDNLLSSSHQTLLETAGGMWGYILGYLALALTFVRSGELRKAEWPELDFNKNEWRPPSA